MSTKRKKKPIKRCGSASGVNKSGDYVTSSGGQRANRRLKTKTPIAPTFEKIHGGVVGISAMGANK